MAAGIYIHIPFCLRKCYYCDFFSKAVDDRELREAYTKALLQEIAFYGAKYGKTFKADSIFFGGGTPSLMEPELVQQIISAIKRAFSMNDDSEISMECNPATLTEEKLSGYKEAGVNRLSIGAQSFDDEVLEELGRIHRSADIVDTVKMARKMGFDNISLDLMFSVPKLDDKAWENSVKTALSLKPDHISFYSLEIAENTEFGKRFERGELVEQPASLDRLMYHKAIEIMKGQGFHQYEISNMALSGKECRHNRKYWRLEDYLALGAGAHGYVKGVRYSNVCDIEKYIASLENQDINAESKLGESEAYGADCLEDYYINSYRDNVSEYVFTALRTNDGVSFKDFKEMFKDDFWSVYAKEKEEFFEYVCSGDAISDEEHIALTEDGMDISNRIMAIFV